MIRFPQAAAVFVVMGLATGCVELQEALQAALHEARPGNDGDGNLPVVTLRVSNPTPQLNEEVVLTCSVIGGDTGGVTFDFQPPNGRLFVDRRAGTATFIVEPADLSVDFTFTCTATSDIGTSGPSNVQVIIPTS